MLKLRAGTQPVVSPYFASPPPKSGSSSWPSSSSSSSSSPRQLNPAANPFSPAASAPGYSPPVCSPAKQSVTPPSSTLHFSPSPAPIALGASPRLRAPIPVGVSEETAVKSVFSPPEHRFNPISQDRRVPINPGQLFRVPPTRFRGGVIPPTFVYPGFNQVRVYFTLLYFTLLYFILFLIKLI